MPNSLQQFLVSSTPKAAANLVEALMRLPEDKHNWSPAETARSAVDMVAECAMLNGFTADLIKSRLWPADRDFGEYLRKKAELAKDWNAVKSLLDANTTRALDAIQETPDEVLGVEIQMPWGPTTLAEILAYPYWNMSYHEGQINYIASILGCLT